MAHHAAAYRGALFDGVPAEFYVYSGLGHGFGLGTGTVAEGWFDLAVNFWERNR